MSLPRTQHNDSARSRIQTSCAGIQSSRLPPAKRQGALTLKQAIILKT